MYKNVTGFYGGMILLRDAELDRRIRAEMASWPFMPAKIFYKKVRQAMFTDFSTWPPLFGSSVFWIFRFGFLHDIRAINKIVTIELDTSRKRAFPDVYRARMRPFQARMILRQLPDLDANSATRLRYSKIYHEGLRDLTGLITPPWREDYTHIYNYFPVQYPDRKRLLRWLMLHGRDLAAQHLKNCAELDSFQPEARPCPQAHATSQQVILLPNYPAYGEAQVRRNVEVIRAFFATAAGREFK
jgi:dTDP-4-amino-4,6-dideoxygalactose transaminase